MNRLHRSGAIDYNVEFALREAQIQNSKHSAGRKTARCWEMPSSGDQLSVCEGEPLFAPKRRCTNQLSSRDACRNPVACMSSLNGYAAPQNQDISVVLKAIEGTKGDIHQLVEPGSAIPHQIRRMAQRYLNDGGDANDSVVKNILQAEAVREIILNDIRFCGISVTKWNFDRAGHQQDQFVSTSGGLNTIYADTAMRAGDTVAIDLPMPSFDNANSLPMLHALKCNDTHEGCNDNTTYGFVDYQWKKGTRKGKKTLAIRSIPAFSKFAGKSLATYNLMKNVRANFMRRGQIIGRCVTGCKKGERIDLVLEGNAVGLFNSADLTFDCCN